MDLITLRREAERALPDTVYQRYGDSPTVKSYTDWSVFERVLSARNYSPGEVAGASPVDSLPRFSFDPSSHRALAYHFSRLPAFFSWDGSPRVVSASRYGHSAQHFYVHVRGKRELVLEDVAAVSSKTLTLDVFIEEGGALLLNHFLHGGHPQYTHLRVHLGRGASFTGRLAVLGRNAHVRYDVFLHRRGADFSLSGLSVTGRSDVVTNATVCSERSSVNVRHLLLSSPGDFLVHRGVLRVDRPASAAAVEMDSAFITSGGFVAAVPQLEVLTDRVRRATHKVRDAGLSTEQLFYMLSRGISEETAWALYVERFAETLLGEMCRDGRVVSALRSFSKTLQR